MINATRYAVAALSGAGDVNIVIQRFPSLRNSRAAVTSLQVECQSDYER